MYVDKIRLVGYYTSNTQNMRSEDIYIDEALKYAELMNYTFKSVKINNIVNGRLKKAITNNTVFIFEDQKINYMHTILRKIYLKYHMYTLVKVVQEFQKKINLGLCLEKNCQYIILLIPYTNIYFISKQRL